MADADLTITPETPAAAPPIPDTGAAGLNFDQDLAALVASPAGQQTPEPTPPPDAETPAEGTPPAEGEPKPEIPAEDPAAPAEPAKAADSMTKRLSIVAEGNRKNEVRAKELETLGQSLTARETQLKADIARIEAIRSAPSRVAMVRELLGGDDAFNDFYLEATDHINGAPARTEAAKTAPASAADIEKVVKAEVEKRLAETDTSRRAAQDKADREARVAYVGHAHAELDKAPSEFPMCFAAPPTSVAITAISDEILRQTGRVPPVKTVLKMIEDERQARHKKAAAKTPAAAKPATTATPSEQTRGAPTSRSNSVPVTPRPQMTFEEELEQIAVKHAAQNAS